MGKLRPAYPHEVEPFYRESLSRSGSAALQDIPDLPEISALRRGGYVGIDVPWSFRPEQVTDTVTIGQRDMAIYLAKNNSNETITGTATFNVEPEQAGAYFNKIQCFCFTEQVLKPGQEVRMPVLYYVDPKALDDPNMDDVEQITLSYTFHRALESAE